ncbi:MAG: Ig-like domain-containing protein [archaeon]|nr:Ig-like domain-containing protein [archaeon]
MNNQIIEILGILILGFGLIAFAHTFSITGLISAIDSTPIVKIDQPANNETMTQTIQVDVTAQDDVKVARVELFIDEQKFGEKNTKPHYFIVNTSKLTDGIHELQAKAIDSAGNIGESKKVKIFVKNVLWDKDKPNLYIKLPVLGQELKGIFTMTAKATDNKKIDRVEFFADGALIGIGIPKIPNYSFAWNTQTIANGEHEIIVKAIDTAGNFTQKSARIKVKNK